MKYLIVLCCMVLAAPALAVEVEIENYTPPPMFDVVMVEAYDAPPLPPRRPAKFKVPERFVRELLIEERITDPLEKTLSRPDRFDILRQIDPQN